MKTTISEGLLTKNKRGRTMPSPSGKEATLRGGGFLD
jgi:hypothetical protein